MRGGEVGVGVFDLGLVGAEPILISERTGSGLLPAITVSRFEMDLERRFSWSDRPPREHFCLTESAEMFRE